MTMTTIPFTLNRKPGILRVDYESNHRTAKSGFDLFAGNGFDVEMCIGYPTMRARIESYEGTGYAAACAWIQVVTRREFSSAEAAEPADVVPDVDTHPTLAESGIPFFAFGFPAEIFDAPCNKLNGLAKLEWVADIFLVTMPNRTNGFSIYRLAGFRWGYIEYDLDGKRQVKIRPLVITDGPAWQQHLPLLRGQFGKWQYGEAA
jgi:hypothetical protein